MLPIYNATKWCRVFGVTKSFTRHLPVGQAGLTKFTTGSGMSYRNCAFVCKNLYGKTIN